MLSDSAKQLIREMVRDAERGERGDVISRLAAQLGICTSTVYRHADLRKTSRSRDHERPEYRDWTQVAVRLAHRAPKPMPLDLALESAIGAGLVPPEAADMPLGTAYRIRRELGLCPVPRRTQRTYADYPMQVVVVDGSASTHLIVDHQLEDGDWLLRLHRAQTPAGGYKNKPLPEHRMRLWIYDLWDMCTGYTRSHPVVARGEAAFDQMAAVCHMMTETGDPDRPLHGVPDHTWSDNGVWAKSVAVQDLVERLRINLSRGLPYHKERQGGAERPWRTLWSRFESSLYALERDTFRLSEIIERLKVFEARENNKRLSRTPVGDRQVTRAAAWVALTNGRPADNPLRRLPDNPLQTLFLEGKRKIDRSGIVRWEGEEYECAQWHNIWVTVRRAVGGGGIVLEHPATGERVTAEPLRRRMFGEVRGIPATALDKLLEQPSPAGADPYAPSIASASGQGNITPLPARTAPAAELDNPLDTAVYPDLDAALADFAAQYPWPLAGDDRQAVIDHLVAAGLRRETVRELAATLLHATEDFS